MSEKATITVSILASLMILLAFASLALFDADAKARELRNARIDYLKKDMDEA